MAEYNSPAVQAQLFAKELYDEAMKKSFIAKFMGSIIDERTDAIGAKGTSFTYGIAKRFTGSGVTDHSTLVGNEEALSDASDVATIVYYRNGFQYDRKLTEQKASFDVPNTIKKMASVWLAEKQDSAFFQALTDSTNTLTIHEQSGTLTLETSRSDAASGITSADVLTPSLLQKARPMLTTGRNRTQPPIKGIMINGREHYVVVQHPDALVDLKLNSEYAQYVREAHVRGESNPLFTGAVAIIDGFIIHESEYIDNTTTANVSRGYILGEDAVVWMWAQRPNAYISDDNSDHGRKETVVVEFMAGVNATNFDSLPYGFMDLYVYCGSYSTLATS